VASKKAGTDLDAFAEAESLRILEARGFTVEKKLPHEPKISIAVRKGATYRWAVVACTHLGGQFQQLTALKDFCKRAVNDYGVERIWHVGDLLMGSSRRHDYIYEAFKHGATAQHDYAAEVLPETGVPWELITGNHDEWWWTTEGIETGVEMSRRRADIHYVGRRAARVDLGGLYVYLHHGDGGVPYALSYKLQRAIERMHPRPDVYMIANWHSAIYMPRYAGSELLMAPCFQAQTPFERRKGLTPTIGGFILDVTITDDDHRTITPRFETYDPIEDDY
jgi:hypothetical protein